MLKSVFQNFNALTHKITHGDILMVAQHNKEHQLPLVNFVNQFGFRVEVKILIF